MFDWMDEALRRTLPYRTRMKHWPNFWLLDDHRLHGIGEISTIYLSRSYPGVTA